MRWLAALAIAAALGLPGAATAATPVPAVDPARSVYDTAEVIGAADEAAMEARHRELYEKTGVHLAVLTVPRLVDETIDELAIGSVTAPSAAPRRTSAW